MPLMAPQLLQDKAPNPNLSFEALHSSVPTALSSRTSVNAPMAHPQPVRLLQPWSLGPCSVPSPVLSVPFPGQVPPLAPAWSQSLHCSACGLSCPFQSILYMAARLVIIKLQTTYSPALITSCCTCDKVQSAFQILQGPQ